MDEMTEWSETDKTLYVVVVPILALIAVLRSARRGDLEQPPRRSRVGRPAKADMSTLGRRPGASGTRTLREHSEALQRTASKDMGVQTGLLAALVRPDRQKRAFAARGAPGLWCENRGSSCPRRAHPRSGLVLSLTARNAATRADVRSFRKSTCTFVIWPCIVDASKCAPPSYSLSLSPSCPQHLPLRQASSARRAHCPPAASSSSARASRGSASARRRRWCKKRWGSRYVNCTKSPCSDPTWLYFYPSGEPVGAGVRFKNNKAVAIFTLGATPGWKSTEGIKVADPINKLYDFYGTPKYTKCIGYEALLADAQRHRDLVLRHLGRRLRVRAHRAGVTVCQ